ncbi:hypothetical protein D9M72_381300 [compost metagenome]
MEALQHLVEGFALHVQARAGGAHLALVEEDGPGGTGGGLVEGGVVEHDHRRLAAQLQGEAGHVLNRRVTDQLAHRGGAGEGQLVDPGMGRQGGTRFGAHTRDDVHHAWRDARFQAQLPQAQGGERGFVRRLEHHRAAARQGRHDLPQGHQQREVPGHDGADHAHRLRHRVGAVLAAGNGANGDIQALAFDLGGPAGHVAQEVDGQLHVHHLGYGGALAVVQAFQLGQFLGVAFHQVGQAPQQVLPLARAHAAPGRIVEGPAGGLHGAVDVLEGGRGHLAEDFACGRVAETHGVAAGGVLPLCADQHLQLAIEEGLGLGEDGQFGEHGREPLFIEVVPELSQPPCQR